MIHQSILVVHGPNLNLLGMREPHHYGNTTLAEINAQLMHKVAHKPVDLTFVQSNSESELIEVIHTTLTKPTQFIILNPAGLTHTSVVLRDAMMAVAIPFVEVHLSNIYAREDFRHHSYFSDIALGVISGLGPQGYILALEYALCYLDGLSQK